jgi:hypothetical protein
MRDVGPWSLPPWTLAWGPKSDGGGLWMRNIGRATYASPANAPCPRLNKTKSTASSGFRVLLTRTIQPRKRVGFRVSSMPQTGRGVFFQEKKRQNLEKIPATR